MGARTVSIDKIRKVCYNDNVGSMNSYELLEFDYCAE